MDKTIMFLHALHGKLFLMAALFIDTLYAISDVFLATSNYCVSFLQLMYKHIIHCYSSKSLILKELFLNIQHLKKKNCQFEAKVKR